MRLLTLLAALAASVLLFAATPNAEARMSAPAHQTQVEQAGKPMEMRRRRYYVRYYRPVYRVYRPRARYVYRPRVVCRNVVRYGTYRPHVVRRCYRRY